MGLQDPLAMGAVLQTQGSQKGVHFPSGPLRGEWWGPQDPRAMLEVRDKGPCAQDSGQRRLLPRQEPPRPYGAERRGVGAGGIYPARVGGARGQALWYARPKYSRRKRWCIDIIMLRETTTDQGVEVEGSRGSRGASGGMVGRAENVTAGGIKGLVAAGAVGPSGRTAAATVGTAEVPRVRGYGTGGATKVARLAEAGGCRAAEATDVAKWAGTRGCCAAGAA